MLVLLFSLFCEIEELLTKWYCKFGIVARWLSSNCPNWGKVNMVAALMNDDLSVMIHQLSSALDLSYGSIQAILTDNFNMRWCQCCTWVPHHLTVAQQQQRVEICNEWLGYLAEDLKFFEKLIVCDELWVYNFDPSASTSPRHGRTVITAVHTKKVQQQKSAVRVQYSKKKNATKFEKIILANNYVFFFFF